MKLHYWGTAAAEGIPSVYCACDVCREAREKGGRYVRARSQVMFDDELLVDMGADTYQNSLKWGYDLSKLTDVLITHVHEDHYYPNELHNLIYRPDPENSPYRDIVYQMCKKLWKFAHHTHDNCVNPYIMTALAPFGPGIIRDEIERF